MLVSFNTAMSTRKSNHPTFKAVNQEWLAKIKKDPDMIDNLYIHFINPHSTLSKRDAIATVKEAAKSFGEGFQEGFRDIIKDIEAAKKN